MNSLWTPNTQPPKMSPEAQQIVTDMVWEHGLVPVAHQAWDTVVLKHKPLGEYVEQLGSAIDGPMTSGINIISDHNHLWPKGVLKTGVGIGMLGYGETGYCQEVEGQALEQGTFFAQIQGIPDSYEQSMIEDPGLATLANELADTAELRQAAVGTAANNYKKVLWIGFGVARYFLQQQILLDA